MNDSYFAQASAQAKKAADEYKSTFDSTLSDLLNISNLQKQQVTNNYNNLLNQINANRASLQEQYKTNARQSYVNKLLADQQTTDTLSRMNLNQSGFRLTQDTLANNQYDASLNQLAMAQDAGLRDLDTQGLNALNTYNNDLLKLDLDYNTKLAALKQQIADNVNNYYNKEYDRFYNDLKYQDQLKQQALENQMKQQQLNVSIRNSYSGGGSSNPTSGGLNPAANNGTGANNNNGANNINGTQNNQYVKYAGNIDKSKLSSNAQYQLATFLTRAGTRVDGKYNPGNTSVSIEDLWNWINNSVQNGTITKDEAQYITNLFDKNYIAPTKTTNNTNNTNNTKSNTKSNTSNTSSTNKSSATKNNKINVLPEPAPSVTRFQSNLDALNNATAGLKYQSANPNTGLFTTSPAVNNFQQKLNNLYLITSR